jgi:hypothetical protein
VKRLAFSTKCTVFLLLLLSGVAWCDVRAHPVHPKLVAVEHADAPLVAACGRSDEVKVGWELVERHMHNQNWVAAAHVLIRCARILEQDEMRQIGAIYDIRLFVLDLYHVALPMPRLWPICLHVALVPHT